MSSQTALNSWNPNTAGSGDGIFGLPYTESQSELVILCAPFEATTSYIGGTSKAPERVFEASQQVDLFHPDYPQIWRKGIAMAPIPKAMQRWNAAAKKLAQQSRKLRKPATKILERINRYGTDVNNWVYQETRLRLDQNKSVGLIGGDHSVPFGAIKAHFEKFPKMGVLHIDAHHDLRKAYEGFEWSHASIFQNVIEKLHLRRLTQIGIRDFCDEEEVFARKHEVKVFRDRDIAARKFKGESWKSIVDEIISTLPHEVYISFDIDGLEPAFCAATGTPVPGGLSYNEAIYLFRELIHSKRRVVGFDLVEIGPDEFDANVGSRLLYELGLMTLSSRAPH